VAALTGWQRPGARLAGRGRVALPAMAAHWKAAAKMKTKLGAGTAMKKKTVIALAATGH